MSGRFSKRNWIKQKDSSVVRYNKGASQRIYKKAAEDISPKWEESSAVFVYRVCVFSVVSFSSAKNRSTFFCARTSSCISSRALR